MSCGVRRLAAALRREARFAARGCLALLPISSEARVGCALHVRRGARSGKPPHSTWGSRCLAVDGRRYLAVALFFAGLAVSCERSGVGCALAPLRATGYFIAIHFSRPPSMIFTLV